MSRICVFNCNGGGGGGGGGSEYTGGKPEFRENIRIQREHCGTGGTPGYRGTVREQE